MESSAVIAIGGNSLIRAGEKGTVPEQIRNARRVARSVASLLADGMRIVVTHGNGPQVGAALLRSERATGQVYEQGLDVCVAATQGEIGYILQQALEQEIFDLGLHTPVSTVLTQVVVAHDDPAFDNPQKPIGPFYSRSAADEKTRTLGWLMAEDASRGYRRVVPSPRPIRIVEEEVIRTIFGQGILAIAMGGGGIPVEVNGGRMCGVDAVIDKDRASELLATRLGVDLLVFATDADCVYLNYRKPDQRPVERATVAEMRQWLLEGQFPPGSMGPKVESVLRFLEAGGKEAVIASHEHLVTAIRGAGGTHIVPA